MVEMDAAGRMGEKAPVVGEIAQRPLSFVSFQVLIKSCCGYLGPRMLKEPEPSALAPAASTAASTVYRPASA